MSTEPATLSFTDLGLSEGLLKALSDVGYETPSPIQAATIPPLMEGRDVLGQAQTGTGKTAAFALPTLSNIDPKLMKTQVLVLAPTRELAIQVAEAQLALIESWMRGRAYCSSAVLASALHRLSRASALALAT